MADYSSLDSTMQREVIDLIGFRPQFEDLCREVLEVLDSHDNAVDGLALRSLFAGLVKGYRLDTMTDSVRERLKPGAYVLRVEHHTGSR